MSGLTAVSGPTTTGRREYPSLPVTREADSAQTLALLATLLVAADTDLGDFSSMNGRTAVGGTTASARVFPEITGSALSEVLTKLARALRSAVAGSIVLSIAACRFGPSFDDYIQLVRGRAGEDAVDCGVTKLFHDRTAAVACATAALEGGRPFFAIFQVQGIDSEIFYGLSVDHEGHAVRTMWDSDGYGGSRFAAKAWMRGAVCEKPRLVGEGLPIRCENDQPDR